MSASVDSPAVALRIAVRLAELGPLGNCYEPPDETRRGKLRPDFVVRPCEAYADCLACGGGLLTPAERAYGVHVGCRCRWRGMCSRHTEAGT